MQVTSCSFGLNARNGISWPLHFKLFLQRGGGGGTRPDPPSCLWFRQSIPCLIISHAGQLEILWRPWLARKLLMGAHFRAQTCIFTRIAKIRDYSQSNSTGFTLYLVKPSWKVNELFLFMNGQLRHHRVESIVQHDICQCELTTHQIYRPRHDFVQILKIEQRFRLANC